MKFLARRKRSPIATETVDDGARQDASPLSPAVVKPELRGSKSAAGVPGVARSGSRLGGGGSSFRLRGSCRNLAAADCAGAEEDADDDSALGVEEYEQHAPSKAKTGAVRRKSRLSDIRSSICSILSNADTVQASNFYGGDDDISRLGGSRRSLLSRGSSFKSLKRQPSYKKQSSFRTQASFKKTPSIRFDQSALEAAEATRTGTGEENPMMRPSAPSRWALRRQSTEHTLSTLGTASTRSTLSSLTGGSSLRSLNTAESAHADNASLASKEKPGLTLPQIGEGTEDKEEKGQQRNNRGSPPTSPRIRPRQAQAAPLPGRNRRGTLTSIPDGIHCIADPDRAEDDNDNITDNKSVCSDLTGFTGGHSALHHEQQQQQQDAPTPAPQPQHQHRLIQSRRGSIERPAAQGRRRSSLIRIPDGIATAEFEFENDDDGTECSELTFPTIARSASNNVNRRGSIEAGAGTGAGRTNRRGSIEQIPQPGAARHAHSRRGSIERHAAVGGPRPSRRGSIERPAAQGRRRSSLVRIPDGIALELAQFDDDDEVSAFGNDSVSSDMMMSASDLEFVAAAESSFGAVKSPPPTKDDSLKDETPASVKDDAEFPRDDVNHNSIRTEEMRPARAGRRRSSLFCIPDDARVLAENVTLDNETDGGSSCDCTACSNDDVSVSTSVKESSCPQLRGIDSAAISDLPGVAQACLRGGSVKKAAPAPTSTPVPAPRANRRYRRSSLDSMMDDESVVSAISYSIPRPAPSSLSRRHSLESAQEDDIVSRSIIDNGDGGGGCADDDSDDDDLENEVPVNRRVRLPDEIGDTQREEAMLESDAYKFEADNYHDEASLAPSLAPSLALIDIQAAPSSGMSVATATTGITEQSLTLEQATAPVPPVPPAPALSTTAAVSSASEGARSSVLDRLQNLDHRRAAQDASNGRAAAANGNRHRRGSSSSSPGGLSSALANALAAQAAASMEGSLPDLRPSASTSSASASLSVLDRIQASQSSPNILSSIQAQQQQQRPSSSSAAASSVLDRIQEQQGSRSTSSILDRIQAQASASAAPRGSQSTSSILDRIQGDRGTRGQPSSSILDRLQAQTSTGSNEFAAAASVASSTSVLDRIQGSQSMSSVLAPLQSERQQRQQPSPSASSESVLDRIRGSRSTSSILDRIQGSSQSTSSILDRLQSQQAAANTSSTSLSLSASTSSVLDRIQGSQSTSSILDRIQSQRPSSSSSVLDRFQGSQSTSSLLDRIQSQAQPPTSMSILDRIQAHASQGPAQPQAQAQAQARPRFAAPPTVLGAPQAAAAASIAPRTNTSNAAPRSVQQQVRVQAPSSASVSVNTGPRPAAASASARRRRTGSAPGSMLANSAAAATSSLLALAEAGSDDDSPSSTSPSPVPVVEVGPPTALYNAVSACAPYQTVRSLIDADPSSTGKQNGGGLAPLHCAIERYDTPIPVLTMLLEANPSVAAMRNRRGHTPLDLLWKRFVDPEPYRSESARTAAAGLRRMMENAVSDDALGTRGSSSCGGAGAGHSSSSPSSSSANADNNGKDDNDKPCHRERARKARAIRALYSSAELREFWELITSFVRAAHIGSLDDDDDRSVSSARSGPSCAAGRWRLLHGAAAVGCPPLLLRFASALNPDHIRLRHGPQGRTPLHHFAASARTVDEDVAVSTARTLLALHPPSASARDGNGRLPLSLAVESRRPWGSLRAMFLANPAAVTTPDSSTGMLPFMTAATGDEADVTVIFRLIRENPLEVMRGIPSL